MMWQVAPMTTVTPGMQVGALILGLAVAIILHEVAHGYVALWLGDPTAKYAGRLTLNPLAHIDIFGTVIVPLVLILSQVGFVFGWAKPVPVNYFNLRHGRYGPLIVALAGPAMNFVILVVAGLLARVSPVDTALPFLFYVIAMINAVLMFFNLIPVPPLDGSKILYVFLDNRPDVVQWLERYGFFILIGLLILGQGLLFTFVFHPAVQLTNFFTGL